MEPSVVFTKRSEAEAEAVRVNGRMVPIYDKEGNITGYKVFGRMELTLSENLRGAVQGSSTPEGTDFSVGATLGDTIEFAKGRKRHSGQDPIDYERIMAGTPSGSLFYQQEHGDKGFESKELGGKYSLSIGDADVSVRGGRFLQDQKTWNLGAGVQVPVVGGLASLNFNRWGGDTPTVNRVDAEYKIPVGRGEAILYGGIQDDDQRKMDRRIGVRYKGTF